jgi:hypothetical protein
MGEVVLMSQSFWESEPLEEQQIKPQEPELHTTDPDAVFLESVDFEPESDSEPELESELEADPQPEPEQPTEPLLVPEPAAEAVAPVEPVTPPAPQPVAESQDSQILELSVDEFTALEERVLRAVNLVKRERLTRVEAEQNAAQLEAQLAEQRPVIDQLQTEVHSLRSERDQVRQRVERLLAQLDALEI